MKKRKKKFYTKQTEQSRVKAEIIAKYFPAWATVVKSQTSKMAYIDLYAGRGRYDDGKESTPLLILQRAIEDAEVSQMLVTIFNDKEHAATLRDEIAALPGVEKLKYKPTVHAMEVGENTAKLFEKIKLVPTLALLDPWGYKGLTRKLIQSLLKDWGCDLIFFFNYNRINMGLRNEKVGKHMAALFGQAWLDDLRQIVPGKRPRQRERAILRALKSGLREVGGVYVRPFRFLKHNGRTSHHLIFVSKSFKGLEVMRDVMAGMSSRHDDDVASFAYSPQMEFPRRSPLPRLQARITVDLAGRTMTVRQLFVAHSGDGRFTMKNYQEALRRLEKSGAVAVQRPSKRMMHAGRPTMPKDARVTIPPLPAGASAEASRSIRVRPVTFLPSSGSVRPTA
jgi:three-Cys-motif partner protein